MPTRLLADYEAEHGKGRLPLYFGFTSVVPPWFPYTLPARRLAEAFAKAKEGPPETPAEEPEGEGPAPEEPVDTPSEQPGE